MATRHDSAKIEEDVKREAVAAFKVELVASIEQAISHKGRSGFEIGVGIMVHDFGRHGLVFLKAAYIALNQVEQEYRQAGWNITNGEDHSLDRPYRTLVFR